MPDINSETSNNSVWIFQTNPDNYRILDALSDPNLEKQTWQVNQHQEEIEEGDVALIWMSGKEAGIYAVADVISEPLMRGDFPEEKKYWVREEDRGIECLKVVIKIRHNLLNKPVLRAELKNIEELEDLSILRFFQGTNFSVSNEEWATIRDLIKDRI